MDLEVVANGLLELPGRTMRAAADVLSVSVANQRSTWLSHDAEVGVKWTWNLGLRANQALIVGVLCVP